MHVARAHADDRAGWECVGGVGDGVCGVDAWEAAGDFVAYAQTFFDAGVEVGQVAECVVGGKAIGC